MYTLNTNLEEVTKEFHFVNNWIETLCDNILNKNKEDCKITMFYDYGYFVPKGKGFKVEQYDMMFSDRLEYELSKIRVNVTIKIDELVITNRLKKGLIPNIIKLMVTEITKYKMLIESEFHQNEEIKNSITDFDNSVVTIEVIKQDYDFDKVENDYFDLDEILDKITKNGIESLSVSERNFLDKKSKEM